MYKRQVSRFLDASIQSVLKTLLEAFILVFIVVYIFLQDFRSTLIPAIAVPVLSLIHIYTVLARAIRALGVYSEIYPHDITAAELKALPNVKGVIINGGPNHVIDGVDIDVLPEIYKAGVPVMVSRSKRTNGRKW